MCLKRYVACPNTLIRCLSNIEDVFGLVVLIICVLPLRCSGAFGPQQHSADSSCGWADGTVQNIEFVVKLYSSLARIDCEHDGTDDFEPQQQQTVRISGHHFQ